MHENTEVDALGEHQLKWTQSGSSKLKLTQSGTAAEANAVGKQQLERMQSGRSSVWPVWLVLARDTIAPEKQRRENWLEYWTGILEWPKLL